jgi:hypothetical protein
MNELIQFILKNFFVVIVIVGFIVSMLNKTRKGNTPSNRMPDFGGGPLIPQPQRQKPIEQRPAGRPMSQPPEPTVSRPAVSQPSYSGRMSSEEGESFEYPSMPQTAAAERPSTVRRNFIPEQTNAFSMTEKQAEFRRPSGDELRRAVILAEILGPPRSKRPLRRQ